MQITFSSHFFVCRGTGAGLLANHAQQGWYVEELSPGIVCTFLLLVPPFNLKILFKSGSLCLFFFTDTSKCRLTRREGGSNHPPSPSINRICWTMSVSAAWGSMEVFCRSLKSCRFRFVSSRTFSLVHIHLLFNSKREGAIPQLLMVVQRWLITVLSPSPFRSRTRNATTTTSRPKEKGKRKRMEAGTAVLCSDLKKKQKQVIMCAK